MLLQKSGKILKAIKALKDTPSTNDKQDLLRTILRDDIGFTEVLLGTYSNEFQYNVRKIEKPSKFNDSGEDNYLKLLDIQLSNTILASDKKVLIAKGLADSNKDNYELMQLMLDRNLRIGIEAKTINKVIGYNLIKQFLPMKPRGTYSEDRLPMYGDFKFNGQRTTVEKVNGTITMFSPSGKIYDIPYIKKQFETLLESTDNVRLDCELDANTKEMGVPDGEFADDSIRLIVNGWMNSVYSGDDNVLRDMDKVKKIRFSIFDLVNLEEAYQEKQDAVGEKMKVRIPKLDKMYSKIRPVDRPNLYFKKPILLETHAEVAVFFYTVVRKKGEGLILKNPDSLYHAGESQEWCKLKNIATTDLQVIDFKYGGDRTKNAGMVTSIVCSTRDNKLIVTVGSGLKQEDIDNLDIRNQAVLLGKIIEVTFTNTTIRQGKPSLFLPRLTGAYISSEESYTNLEASTRSDKAKADTYRETLIAESNYARNLISKLERFKIKHGISKVYNKMEEHIKQLLKG